jgi:hypothetical protein
MTPSQLRTGLLASALLAALAAPASAGSETGFAFLELPAGARVAAMGGAGATLAEGPAALFWNPAGIAPAIPAAGSHGRASFDHHESIQTFRQELVGGVLEKDGDGIGLGLNAHYTEGIDERDELGNLLGTFGATDFAVVFGMSKTASPGLRLGGALQWTHEDLAGVGASAFGLSGGLLWDPVAIEGLRIGASVRNIGPSPSFKAPDGSDGASVSQPTTFEAGASFGNAGSFSWRAAADVVQLKGESMEGRLGLEIKPIPSLALRAGWMTGQDAADLTAGAGVAVGRFDIDYAFVPYKDDLGTSHRFGLTARL